MPAAENQIDTLPIMNKNQGGVQSLEIGLSVLDVLIDYNEPMMLKDVAQAMQMHPAKCHRYLVSLIRKNYARQLNDGRYGLGDRVHAMGALGAVGHSGFNQNNILDRLTHIANEIKDTLNCGVQIAKWFSEGPIIIQSVEPDTAISIITRIGSRMPLTTSATGHLFASYQPDAVIKPLVIAEWKAKQEPAITEKWQNFNQLRAKVRTQGYATVTGDMLMGINAITIPVIIPQLDNNNINISPSNNGKLSTDSLPLEYAITIIGTTEQLPMSEQRNVVEQILAIAQRYQIV